MSKNLFYKMLRKIQNIAVNSRILGEKETKFLKVKFLGSRFLPEIYPKFTHFLPAFYLKISPFLPLIFLFLCAMIILVNFLGRRPRLFNAASQDRLI